MLSRRIRQQRFLLVLFPDVSSSSFSSTASATATATARTITTFPSIRFPLYCQHPQHHCPPLPPPRSSSSRYQQGQQRQIRRSYWFVPVSWEEFQERAERWWETKQSRIIQVRLLDEKAAKQKKQKQKRKKYQRFQDSLQKRKESYRGWKVRRQQQYQVLMARYNTIIGRQHKFLYYQEQWKARRRRRRHQHPPGYLRRWKQQLNFQKKNILVEEYSEPAWFEARTGRPLTSKDPTGQRFVNPWQSQSTNGIQSVTTILQWQWQRFQRTFRTHYVQPTLVFLFGRSNPNNTNNDSTTDDVSPLGSQRIPPLPSLSQFNNKNRKIHHNLWMTWIGHSTCLFQIQTTTNNNHSNNNQNNTDDMDTSNKDEERGSHHTTDDDAVQSFTIITDPMFSTRASPYTNYIGVPREVPPAHTIPELLAHLHTQQQQQTKNSTRRTHVQDDESIEKTVKETAAVVIDVCCITHDHYDHMDTASLQQLQAHVRWWVVPLGLAEWLVERCGIHRAQIVELEWWEKVWIQKKKKKQNNNNNNNKGNGNDRDDSFTVRTYNSHRHGRADTTMQSDDNDDDDDEGSDTHHTNSNGDANANTNQALTITCCPASHWSGRTVMDRNKRLWCSFAISFSSTAATAVAATTTTTKVASPASSFLNSSLLSNPNSAAVNKHKEVGIVAGDREIERETPSQPTNKNEFEDEDEHNKNKKIFDIFFCGDTSYPNNFPLFQQIGDAMGPFDLACIPIGAYLPKEMNENAHCDPSEALKIHNDIRSRQSIGIHWGSFKLGEERFVDPPKLLADAVLKQQQQQQLDNNRDKDDTSDDKEDEQKSSLHPIKFHVIGHGGTVALEK